VHAASALRLWNERWPRESIEEEEEEPTPCEFCGGTMKRLGTAHYQCQSCGAELHLGIDVSTYQVGDNAS
jgi:ribosomal protein L37AE/L43A